MSNIIIMNGCRILSPTEYRSLREKLNPDHKTVFDALLFTGMRGTEFEVFAQHTEWFDKNRRVIRLTPQAVKKVKIKFKDRSVNLSFTGFSAIERFIDYKPHVSLRASWGTSLKRAAIRAGLDTTGIEPKMTRKTCECWLISSFPKAEISILSSMGHTQTTALNHYVNISFTKQEKEDIKQYTNGWSGINE